MVSEGTYNTWNVVVPAVLSCLLWGFLLVLIILVLLLYKKLPLFFVSMLQLSLSDITEDDDCSCIKVDKRKIKKTAVNGLAVLVVPLTIVTIFFSFWNVWLVEEEASGACLPNFDCFPVLDGEILQDTPVESCSQSFNTSKLANATAAITETAEVAAEDVSYKCYRFVFRYAQGFGAAGGVLFFTAVFSKVYFCLLIALIKSKHCECLSLVVLNFVWISAIVLLILFVVVNAAIPIVREAVFSTHTDTIQFTLYAMNFLAVVVGGYVVSAGVIIPAVQDQPAVRDQA